MTALWPATLPQKPRSDPAPSGTFPDTVLRTEMEVGPAKVRRRFSVAVRPMTLVFRLDPGQFTTFEGFVSDTLAGGALPFLLPDPWASGTTLTVRLTRPPRWQAAAVPGKREVTLELEVMPT